MASETSITRTENDNLTRLYLGERITIWFSYETPVAFAISGEGTFKQEKGRHSRTTDRHLSSIPGTSLGREEFDQRLRELMNTLNAAIDNSTAITSVPLGATA